MVLRDIYIYSSRAILPAEEDSLKKKKGGGGGVSLKL